MATISNYDNEPTTSNGESTTIILDQKRNPTQQENQARGSNAKRLLTATLQQELHQNRQKHNIKWPTASFSIRKQIQKHGDNHIRDRIIDKNPRFDS